jgi:AcrR family transcriptional regulator
MSPPPSSREAIIDAAETVVLEKGARHMTLDAVAAGAGVSKGGLLYHFASKEDLLKAMLERLIKILERRREEKGRGVKEGPERDVKTFVLSRVERDPKMEQIGSAVLAAAAHDPRLLQPAREEIRKTLSEMQSGLGFTRATLIFFAVQGLNLTELLSLSPLTTKERKKFVEALLRMAHR